MKKRYIVVSALNLACLILFIVMVCVLNSVSSKLTSQSFYKRWAADGGNYTQISLFTSTVNALDLNGIYMNRYNLEQEMSKNSIAKKVITLPDGTTVDNGRLWADAYSGSAGNLTVINDSKSADADVIFTGGDFFLFHPLRLLSGSYYSEDELMKDRIVIDENLAWQLFGSSNVNGKNVKINGYDFVVAGVIERDNDSASKLTYGDKPMLYMSYEAAVKLNSIAPITSYEVCIPETLKGLGIKLYKEALSPDETKTIVVENKTRYSYKNLINVISKYNISRISDSAVIYPYWENAARILENKAAVALLIMMISLVLPLLTVIVLFGILIKNRQKVFSKIKGKFKKGK